MHINFVFLCALALFTTSSVGQLIPSASDASQKVLTWQPGTCPQPVFPRAALRAKVTGATRVLLTVDAEGKVTEVEVTRSSGSTPMHSLLDESAVTAMKGCKFESAPAFSAAREIIWRIVD